MASSEPRRLDHGRGGAGTVTSLRLPSRPVPPGFKRCPKCEEVKPLSGFNIDRRKKSGVQSRCRPCAIADKQDYRRRNPLTAEQKQRQYEAHARYRIAHRQELRQRDHDRRLNDEMYQRILARGNRRSLEKRHERSRCFARQKGEVGCLFCGEDESCALDLHHVNPTEKDFPVGNMFGSFRWDRIVEEAAKCVVICANCHRKHHEGLLPVPEDAARFTLPADDPGASIHRDGRKYGLRWESKRAADAAAGAIS